MVAVAAAHLAPPRRAPPQPPAAAAARPPRRAPPQPPPPPQLAPHAARPRSPRSAARPPQPPRRAPTQPPQRRAPPAARDDGAALPARPYPCASGPSGRRAPSPAPAAGPEGFFGLYQGASNHEELHNLMKATVMIRRLKKDVLSQLPVKRRQQVFLDLSEKDVKNVRALFIELETLKIKIDCSDSKEMVDSLRFAYQNIVNKIYTDSAVAKIPAVLDFLGTTIEVIT
ncbi:uncharacterized protein [Miscanthus floridulus]|uniref:uncharacterized protein n=1 Tax=Miscanthus floridulus TaxID=154761 RepID=UPI003458863F